jgi:hypothetical protein
VNTGSFWETLWAALTSVALIVAALGFIAKRAFDQALKRDLEKYKSVLAAEMQRHKSDLDKDLEAHKNNLKIAGDKELEIIRLANSKELEGARSLLAFKKAEEDARRDYEYEARKRLYEQYEPLLFQLVEACENAHFRVRSLARVSRHGEINPGQGWLSVPDYYLLSTIYNLMAPMAVFRMIKQRLTLFDLGLVPLIKMQYALSKQLYYLYTEHHELALDCKPKLLYTPNANDWQEKRQKDSARYWRQGIAVGRLDNAVAPFLKGDINGLTSLKSYGEFEKAYYNDAQVRDDLQFLVDIFIDFHPRTRPVLWRLLITQIHLCEGIADTAEMRGQTLTADYRPLRRLSEDTCKKFDWRPRGKGSSNEQVLKEPFNAAEQFLAARLPALCEWTVSPGAPFPADLMAGTQP